MEQEYWSYSFVEGKFEEQYFSTNDKAWEHAYEWISHEPGEHEVWISRWSYDGDEQPIVIETIEDCIRVRRRKRNDF